MPQQDPRFVPDDPRFSPDTEPTGLQRDWKTINTPLLPQPAEWGRSVANWMDTPTLATSPTGEGGISDFLLKKYTQSRGLVGGMAEGLGNVISEATTPLNAATMGLGFGSSTAARMGLSQIAKLMGIGSRVAAVPFAIHGGAQVLNPESTLAERGMGLAEAAGGTLGIIHNPAIVKPRPKIIPESRRLPIDAGPSSNRFTVGPKGTIIDLRPEDFLVEGLTPESNIGAGQVSGPTQLTQVEPGVSNRPLVNPAVSKPLAGELKSDSIGLDTLNSPKLVQDAYNNGQISQDKAIELLQQIHWNEVTKPTVPVKATVPTKVEPTFVLNKEAVTPESITQVRDNGYTFQGINEKGDYTFSGGSTKPIPTTKIESPINAVELIKSGEVRNVADLQRKTGLSFEKTRELWNESKQQLQNTLQEMEADIPGVKALDQLPTPKGLSDVIKAIPRETGDAELDSMVNSLRAMRRRKGIDEFNELETQAYNGLMESIRNHKALPPELKAKWNTIEPITNNQLELARTKSGGVKIGADVTSLGKVLGSSLYSGDISTIATKELLQNSLDAIGPGGANLGPKGRIDVKLSRFNKTIEVTDNGKGLTRPEVETVFTDLGSSGKRDIESAIGGFGLAKAAPLLGGEHVTVKTIARNKKDGQLHEISFEGTPDDLLSGVQLNDSVISEGTPTGTSVKVKVGSTDFYGASNFVKRVAEHSDVQGHIFLDEGYGGPTQMTGQNLGTSKHITTIDNPAATVNLTIPSSATIGEHGSINVVLKNNGMFQSTDRIYLNNKISDIPDIVSVDIHSKVSEGHADYPFTANREQLRGTVKEDVNKYIQDNIVLPALKKYGQGVQELYDGMISTGHKFGRPIHFYDVGKKMTPDEFDEVIHSPVIQRLGQQIDSIIQQGLAAIKNPTWSNRLEKIGIIFSDKLRGIHIPNPKGGTSAILVDPLQLFSTRNPDEAAAGLLHTTLHEMAHIEPHDSGHGENFCIRLGDIYEQFGASRALYQQKLTREIITEGSGEYTPEIQKLLQIYQESRGRSTVTDDILTRTGSGSKSSIRGTKEVPSNIGPNRTRVSTKSLAEEPIQTISPEANAIILRIKDKPPEQVGIIREAWNLTRGLKSVDLPFITSAGFRQGFNIIGTGPWLKAWVSSFRAYGSKEVAAAHTALLKADPLAQRQVKPVLDFKGKPLISGGQPVYKETPSIIEQAGLKFIDIGSLSTRQEAANSQLGERIWGYGRHVAASNRAYAAWVNDARLGAFRNLYDAMANKNDLVLLKRLGEVASTFTGRGSLNVNVPKFLQPLVKGKTEVGLERYASALAEGLFSPRLIASRMSMFNPMNYLMGHPQVRKEYLKSALRMAGAWTTMAVLAKASGAEVSFDPTSADFLKFKWGNLRLDPLGSFQQFLVLASRLATQETTSSTTNKTKEFGVGYNSPTVGSVTGNFFVNKLHPMLKDFYDAAYANEKKPFPVIDRAFQQVIPMMSGDLVNIAQEKPELLPILAPLISGGMGAQVYDKNSFGKSQFIPPEYDYLIGKK